MHGLRVCPVVRTASAVGHQREAGWDAATSNRFAEAAPGGSGGTGRDAGQLLRICCMVCINVNLIEREGI